MKKTKSKTKKITAAFLGKASVGVVLLVTVLTMPVAAFYTFVLHQVTPAYASAFNNDPAGLFHLPGLVATLLFLAVAALSGTFSFIFIRAGQILSSRVFGKIA